MKLYLHVLSFLNAEMAEVVQTLSSWKTRLRLPYIVSSVVADDVAIQEALWPLLLTWFNFNLNMDK